MTTPSSTQSVEDGMIGFLVSSHEGVILNAHSMYAMFMNNEAFATSLPTQILSQVLSSAPRYNIGRETGSGVPPPRAVGEMPEPVCLRDRICELS